jgi:hypothetical protein
LGWLVHLDTQFSFLFWVSLGMASPPGYSVLFFFSEYHLGWLVYLDTHFSSRPLEALLLDTRLTFLFKTSRGVAFRHPSGIFLGIPWAVQHPMFHIIFWTITNLILLFICTVLIFTMSCF